jgi:hypothetical protein
MNGLLQMVLQQPIAVSDGKSMKGDISVFFVLQKGGHFIRRSEI